MENGQAALGSWPGPGRPEGDRVGQRAGAGERGPGRAPAAEPQAAKVLVADDEPDVRWSLSAVLGQEGFTVLTAADGRQAVRLAEAERPGVAVLDLRMPELGGLEALAQIRARDASIRAIILTAHGDIPSAVHAMRLGAFDYLTKPFDNDALVGAIRRAAEDRGSLSAIETSEVGDGLGELRGRCLAMRRVFQQIDEVAPTGFTVLLQGETGTGKELVARAIHQRSGRAHKPFVPVDCGAIPETLIESELFGHERGAFTGADRRRPGRFELAAGGTLFLDEIANLPPSIQPKLLRAIQSRRVLPLGAAREVEVAIRIIAATNADLGEAVAAGRFRADLYYRINEVCITLPPLRERREDIPPLAAHFLAEAAQELRKPTRGLSEAAVARLVGYAWPGNVRELQNVIRRAALRAGDLVEPQHLSLPAPGGSALATETALDEAIVAGLSLKDISGREAAGAERAMIGRVLRKVKGNKSQAARILRVDYKTLHNKLKAYGMCAREFAP
jgi:two-component system nitrogen regulation response regulator GlnG